MTIWQFNKRLKASWFLFLFFIVSQFLKAKEQQAEVVFKFILQLPQWSFGWLQKAKCQTSDTYTEEKKRQRQRTK